jgi:hypothetical protein
MMVRKEEINMAKTSVFGIATTRNQAEFIVTNLQSANFSSDDISALFPDTTTTRDFAHEKHTKAPEGLVAGAGTGGVVGGALGWIAGIGALAIPGVGPFIAAGPIVAALSGAAIGAAVGGIAGTLIGMGIPEIEAKRYEDKIREGNILISVHTDSAAQIARAKDIFREAGAHDVCVTGETPIAPGQPGEDPAEYLKQPSFAEYRHAAELPGGKTPLAEPQLREGRA